MTTHTRREALLAEICDLEAQHQALQCHLAQVLHRLGEARAVFAEVNGTSTAADDGDADRPTIIGPTRLRRRKAAEGVIKFF